LKLVFLYTELAGYLLASVRDFLMRYPAAEVHVVRYPVNPEAPFYFESFPGLFVYDRKDFLNASDLYAFCLDLQADAVLCSGWIDKEYLAVCKLYKKRIPVVLVLDTRWNGSVRQHLLRLSSPFTLKRWFSHVWVPGAPQREYALLLGFKEAQIAAGFYCADVSFFSEMHRLFAQSKSEVYPKRFICVARYIPAKNLALLWDAFVSLHAEFPDWELWCLGQGELFDVRLQHPAIKHVGFVQPQDLETYIGQSGVFVLPSLYEPWGVVVHEYAAAGFPLLLSNKVGAVSAFLEEGKNGFSFDPENKGDCINKMKQVMSLSQDEWNAFSNHSLQLSQRVSLANWTASLLGFGIKQRDACVE